jgi:hypothetical protein
MSNKKTPDEGATYTVSEEHFPPIESNEPLPAKEFLTFLQLAYSLCKQYVSWYEREIKGTMKG